MVTVARVPPSILIAETNPYLVEALPSVLHQRIPDLRFDVCSTKDHITQHLLRAGYDTVISNVHLAGIKDCVLKRNPGLESVPLVITAEVSDKDHARQALEQGAFDLITSPLDPDQTVTTVRLALWYNRLLRMISSNEKAIEKYRQHMNAFPGDEQITARFQRNLGAVSSTLAAVEKSIHAVHRSGFSDLATTVVQQTRAKALERLHGLCREGAENIQAAPPHNEQQRFLC